MEQVGIALQVDKFEDDLDFGVVDFQCYVDKEQ